MLDNIRDKAELVRVDEGLTNRCSLDVWSLLKNQRISVIKRPLSPGISGAFLRRDQTGLVLINTTKTLGHQVFTAAHEYYHLRFSSEHTSMVCKAGRFDSAYPIERAADQFAAMLLAPEEVIERYLQARSKWKGGNNELTMDDVIALEQYLGISHQAMLIRLKEIGRITDSDLRNMSGGVSKRAAQLGYPITLYRATNEFEVYSEYVEKAKLALERDLISVAKYEELLMSAGLGDLLFFGDSEEDVSDAEDPF